MELHAIIIASIMYSFNLLLLLLKDVDNVQLRESDLHPMSPNLDPSSTLPTYSNRKKEEKGKIVKDKMRASCLGK